MIRLRPFWADVYKRQAFVGAIHGGYEWNTANLAYAMIDYFERNPVAVPDAVTLHIVCLLYTSRCV